MEPLNPNNKKNPGSIHKLYFYLDPKRNYGRWDPIIGSMGYGYGLQFLKLQGMVTYPVIDKCTILHIPLLIMLQKDFFWF